MAEIWRRRVLLPSFISVNIVFWPFSESQSRFGDKCTLISSNLHPKRDCVFWKGYYISLCTWQFSWMIGVPAYLAEICQNLFHDSKTTMLGRNRSKFDSIFSFFFCFVLFRTFFLRCPQRISLTQGGDENIFWHTLCWFLCGSVVSLSLTSVNKVATRSMLGTAPVFTESDARYLVPFLYQI